MVMKTKACQQALLLFNYSHKRLSHGDYLYEISLLIGTVFDIMFLYFS